MGKEVQIYCSHCKYSQTFHIGGGLKSIFFSSIIEVVEERLKEKLMELQQEGAQNFMLIYGIHNCEYCHELFALPIIHYTQHKIAKQLYGSCPKCHTPVLSYKGENEEIYCPQCKKKPLSISQLGFWD